MWDRTDALLDYSWKESENQKNRRVTIQQAKMQYDAQVAAANAKKGGWGSALGSIAGSVLGNYAGSVAGSEAITAGFAMLSDERLKKDMKFHSVADSGVKYYTWEWNDTAKRIGAKGGTQFGVIAQEVEKMYPDAVKRGVHGYLEVDYRKIPA
jgi:hypothetical protein